MRPSRCGKSRFTRPGSSTLQSEIAAPQAAVPASRAGKVPGVPGVQGPQQQPGGEHRHGAQQHTLGPEAAGQDGSQRGEDARAVSPAPW